MTSASLLLFVFLAACAWQEQPGPGGGGPPPPIGSFALGVPSSLTVVAGGEVGFTVEVVFGQGFSGSVQVMNNFPTGGLSIWYDDPVFGPRELNNADMVLNADGMVDLILRADANPQTVNAFFEIVGQGLDENGNTSGQPQVQKTVAVAF